MIKREFVLREYESGGKEIYDITNRIRKIIYNTGDVVYTSQYAPDGKPCSEYVIKIQPHDHFGRYRDIHDWIKLPDGTYKAELRERPETHVIDSVEFPRMTRQALAYEKKKKILSNLQKNAHYYDKVVADYIQRNDIIRRKYCSKCKGTGELHVAQGDYDVGVWESEGGAHVLIECDACAPTPVRVDREAIITFFNLPRDPAPKSDPKKDAIISKFKKLEDNVKRRDTQSKV